MAISRALGRNEVPHVLVGQPPAPAIRLGESLNLEGSLDLEILFPELSDYYFAKSAVLADVGDQTVACDLDLSTGWVARWVYRLLGYRPPEGFLHVDRVGFDPAVFDIVEGPRYQILAAQEDSDRVRVRIAGQGRRDGQAVEAEPVWVTYRFAGDRVAEIWTRRENYVFFFGERIRKPVYLVWLMLRIVVWCWLEPPG